MTQYRYEYGKRWDARVPRGLISHIVAKLHVGTTDDEITRDMHRRCDGNPAFTPALTRQTVAYALECHRQNRDLYRRVVSGKL